MFTVNIESYEYIYIYIYIYIYVFLYFCEIGNKKKISDFDLYGTCQWA